MICFTEIGKPFFHNRRLCNHVPWPAAKVKQFVISVLLFRGVRVQAVELYYPLKNTSICKIILSFISVAFILLRGGEFNVTS